MTFMLLLFLFLFNLLLYNTVNKDINKVKFVVWKINLNFITLNNLISYNVSIPRLLIVLNPSQEQTNQIQFSVPYFE